MTLARIAFWFGFLELGFVLRSGGAMGANVFLLWAGGGCVCLMWPQLAIWLERVRPRDQCGTDGW